MRDTRFSPNVPFDGSILRSKMKSIIGTIAIMTPPSVSKISVIHLICW